MKVTGLSSFDDEDHEDLAPEINVTPLVDVFLVLLLVFMITAPLLQHVVDVDLPELSTARSESPRSVAMSRTLFSSK